MIAAADEIVQEEDIKPTIRKTGFKSRRKSGNSVKKKVSFRDEKDHSAGDSVSGTKYESQPDPLPILLPVTSNSPDAFRRRIVYDQLIQSLNSYFPGHVSGSILSQVKPLIQHLSLTPENITMHPDEWTLVSLFLMRFMEVRSRLLMEKSIADGADRDTVPCDCEELSSLLNNEQVCKLAESFYQSPHEWQQKVNLFLYFADA